jgi:hypothetical protein
MIASLGTAETIQENNRDNAVESETKLTSYAAPST